MTAIDWGALAGLVLFLVAGFSAIPLDEALERRRRNRGRWQAHRIDRW